MLDSAHPRQQVSRTLEYAYDDYVVAQALQLYIDYHQYKNKWWRQNRPRNDNDTVATSCAASSVDNNECQMFPVISEEGNITIIHIHSNLSCTILTYPLSYKHLTGPYEHLTGSYKNLTGRAKKSAQSIATIGKE